MNLPRAIYKDKVRKETFWAIISKGISSVFGLFLLIFIPIIAGPEVYGGFSLLLAYIYVMGIFFGSPISEAVKKEITEGKFNKTAKAYFYEGLKLKIILSILGSLIVIVGLYLFSIEILKEYLGLFLGLLILMNIWGLIVTSFEAAHRLFFEVIMYITEYGTKMLLILYFIVFSSLTIKNLLISFIAGYFLATLVGLLIIYYKFKGIRVRTSKTLTKKILERSILFTLSNISMILMSRIDTIMISLFLSLESVGFYNIAGDITKHSTILSMPLLLGVIPLFARKKSKHLLKKNLYRLLALNITLSIAIIIFSGVFVKLVYGQGYSEVITLLRVLSVLPLLIILQTFFQQILVLKDRVKEIFVFGLLATIMNIVFNIIGVNLLGLVGVAFATILSYLLWTVISLIYVQKLIQD